MAKETDQNQFMGLMAQEGHYVALCYSLYSYAEED